MLQKLKKIDGVIVIVLIMLMCVSIFSIFSVTHGRELDGFHLRMLKYYILGFAVFVVLAFVDYRIFIKYALYLYLFGVGLLALVNLFGQVHNGARGWVEIGGLSLQPAELFKLVLILFLSSVIARKQGSALTFWKGIVPLGLLTLLPFAIVIVQNDLGNALSYIVILLGLLWIGNIKFSHALIGLIIVGGLSLMFVFSYIHYHDQVVEFIVETTGRDHLIDRFDPWLVPDLATDDASYHTRHAKLAIASGGMSGEGYMQGSSVQSNQVPYTYTDAIFVQIAEEFGFLGAALLLLLFFILIHRMILIALESKDRSGKFLIIGMVAMLLYQILENIGAFIGLMPLTGITLPFISYGGTSVLINMSSMGIVMSVHLYGQEIEDELPRARDYAAQVKGLKG
ncbi:FtsW/RodA/SpoVE family cell cycle protein [Paenibacillus monticola]|uniref:Rod shape-determining protein RodA n=1 Tax=Paenibacillus monticola TaxID=2666075 RepID=A0A7X2L2C0_9BACL|nr:FtsW/RodA/SpoVE family cell cycle protein [Paenibacillus monticola]MRN54234.1 rod shape-determining protein RodA [Paenibacillus monticola]